LISISNFLYNISNKEYGRVEHLRELKFLSIFFSWYINRIQSIIFETIIMTSCVDEVLIIKIQNAVKEIGAELRLATNFTSETSKHTKNRDERRLERNLISVQN